MKIAGIDIAPAEIVWLGDEPVARGHSATAAALLEADVQNEESFSLMPEDTDAILEVLTALPVLNDPPAPLVELRVSLMEVGAGVPHGLS